MPTITDKHQPTQLEARLAEYTVAVRLLFDDAIAHGMKTKSVEIAGRLLYSQGHEDLMKYFVEKARKM